MGRTMDVGTTDANFLNNVGVANNVPVVPQHPVCSQYPGFPNSYTLLDLYHYSAPGTRVFTQTPGYFSIDGGNTNLNNFDATAGDDPGNWAATVPNDAFGVSVARPHGAGHAGGSAGAGHPRLALAFECFEAPPSFPPTSRRSISRRRRRAATGRITSSPWRPARR